MKIKKIYTKKPMMFLISSVRVSVGDALLILKAAAALGISRSEFIRTALKIETARVLAAPDKPAPIGGE